MKKIVYVIIAILIYLITAVTISSSKLKKVEDSFITLPNKINTVASHLYKNRTRLENIESRSKFYFTDENFFNSITGLVSTNTKRIIDVSSYQGDIDWETIQHQIDGVILRIGYGSQNIDNKFVYNLNEVKRLKIPYGIYLYSYAENKKEALEEAEFTKKIIEENEMNPVLGVYYDIETFYLYGKKVYINKEIYQKIIEAYINYLKEYNTSVYTYAKLYKYKFNETTKQYVTWIAQYHYTFKHEPQFTMWQYTDSEKIDGIQGKVDMNVLFSKKR